MDNWCLQPHEAQELAKGILRDALAWKTVDQPHASMLLDPYQLLHKLHMIAEEITRRHSQWQAMRSGGCSDWDTEDSALRFLLDECIAESGRYPAYTNRDSLQERLTRLEQGYQWNNHYGGWDGTFHGDVNSAMAEAKKVLSILAHLNDNPTMKQLQAGARQLLEQLRAVARDVHKARTDQPVKPYSSKEAGSLQLWLESYTWRAQCLLQRTEQVYPP
mmetsp:Transcript_2836/g.6988  ORF Transcript_2836/g.6988 Transcript_2836/m.6988 type:complete len:218 (-) Transcript_2836:38-691(-)